MTNTNSLSHTITTTFKGNPMIIKITLDDHCKNGHQDFSITGTTYRPFTKGDRKDEDYKVFNGKNYTFDCGGCIHDEILKARPDLKIFVDLHLCDYTGCPMHTTANGFYHLTNGFNNTKIEDTNFKKEYCEYYRITGNQFDVLSTSKTQTQFAVNLYKLGVLAQWQEQANKAILLLEEMTGNKFLIDSKRTQFVAPTDEELKEEESRQNSGYYTDKAQKEREKQAALNVINDLKKDLNKAIQKASNEYKAKLAVLKAGGKKALDNCIYYNHTNTICFNWRNYDNLSTETINQIKSKIKLPKGVSIESK